ncbi:MAG: diaminopimelate epimerase [Terracidiphilus sp.]
MIPFTKAHACGNDFLIVTEEAARNHDWAALTQRLCARNTGVGADGIEFFAWTGPKSGRIRLHNADGSVAEISGNGTRCVAAWMAQELNARSGDELRIDTDAGLRVCRIDGVRNGAGFAVDLTAGMGVPELAAKTLRLADGSEIEGLQVSTGNPHFVIVAGNAEFSIEGKSWQAIGAEICVHPDFPHQTNVEFVHVNGAHEIEIRIWERGVGPTSSSGTGASATATAAIALGLAKSPLAVVAPGGAQAIVWDGPGTELFLTGPAALIARGEAY